MHTACIVAETASIHPLFCCYNLLVLLLLEVLLNVWYFRSRTMPFNQAANHLVLFENCVIVICCQSLKAAKKVKFLPEQRVITFGWINSHAVNIVTIMSPDICPLSFASSPYGTVCRQRVKRISPMKRVAVLHGTIPYSATATIQPKNWPLIM